MGSKPDCESADQRECHPFATQRLTRVALWSEFSRAEARKPAQLREVRIQLVSDWIIMTCWRRERDSNCSPVFPKFPSMNNLRSQADSRANVRFSSAVSLAVLSRFTRSLFRSREPRLSVRMLKTQFLLDCPSLGRDLSYCRWTEFLIIGRNARFQPRRPTLRLRYTIVTLQNLSYTFALFATDVLSPGSRARCQTSRSPESPWIDAGS